MIPRDYLTFVDDVRENMRIFWWPEYLSISIISMIPRDSLIQPLWKRLEKIWGFFCWSVTTNYGDIDGNHGRRVQYKLILTFIGEAWEKMRVLLLERKRKLSNFIFVWRACHWKILIIMMIILVIKMVMVMIHNHHWWRTRSSSMWQRLVKWAQCHFILCVFFLQPMVACVHFTSSASTSCGWSLLSAVTWGGGRWYRVANIPWLTYVYKFFINLCKVFIFIFCLFCFAIGIWGRWYEEEADDSVLPTYHGSPVS